LGAVFSNTLGDGASVDGASDLDGLAEVPPTRQFGCRAGGEEKQTL
jgi:hypothetical protein